ncbi:LytR C-terminal domain-containing protein [Rhodococcus sp. HNM0569]|nr:LytR C-terminal domain-containing protein [Rhodococcus sp. HNM0569]NLU83148.1 LytR C-terminal domain-containing protein [Rhodococcus sp. HNM0569]
MVLIAFAIVFAGLGFASMGGDDEDTASSAQTSSQTSSAAAITTAQRTASGTAGAAQATSGTQTTSGAAASGAAADVPVGVYNNSSVAGLAAETASTLTSAGWEVAETGNFTAVALARTTVYYGTDPAQQAAAEKIAADLGDARVAPRIDGLPGTPDSIVVVVQSQ